MPGILWEQYPTGWSQTPILKWRTQLYLFSQTSSKVWLAQCIQAWPQAMWNHLVCGSCLPLNHHLWMDSYMYSTEHRVKDSIKYNQYFRHILYSASTVTLYHPCKWVEGYKDRNRGIVKMIVLTDVYLWWYTNSSMVLWLIPDSYHPKDNQIDWEQSSRLI